jgi:type VI secretion system protein ImpA
MQLEALNGVDSDGTLISALDEIKILDGPNGTRISGSDYYYAMEAELDSSKASIDRRNQLRATIDEALKLTPVDTLTCWLEDAEASLAEWDKLREVLEARCRPAEGADSVAPPSSRVRDRLNLSIERLRRLIGKPAGDAPPDQAAGAASGGEAGGAATSAKGTAVSGTIQTREEAFRALLTVASFFRRTEPHSPISYALEQVVKWGRMTLPELIRELIADETTRGELAKRTGIPLESEDSSS